MVASSANNSGTSGPEDVGRRLSIVLSNGNNTKSRKCRALVVAFIPKTQKHRIRFDADQHEKNVLLQNLPFRWLDSADNSSSSTTAHHGASALEVTIQRDAVGRRIEVFHHVRQKWYQGTVRSYVEHCHQHTVVLEPHGKVHLVDLQQCPWRYIDLIESEQCEDNRNPQDLRTSKYLGVVRYTESTWKAYYDNYYTSSNGVKDIGCFASEKDAALAYDVYARKKNTAVNVANRRICKAELKRLRVAEPPAPVKVTSGPPPELPSIVASASTETAATDLPAEHHPEEAAREDTRHSDGDHEIDSVPSFADEASAAKGHETDETPSLADDAASEASLPTHMGHEDEQEQQGEHSTTQDSPKKPGRVTPTCFTDLAEGSSHSAGSRSLAKAPPVSPVEVDLTVVDASHSQEESESKRASSKKSKKARKRRISDHDEDDDESMSGRSKSVKVKTTKKTSRASSPVIRADIFEDSDDEECEFQGDEDEESHHTSETDEEEDHDNHTSTKGMANIFDSDDDDESVKLAPKRKSKKELKSRQNQRHRHRPATEETLSSDDEDADNHVDYDALERACQKFNKKLKRKEKKRRKILNPKYPVGTRFVKEFPDYGIFEGEITEFDGRHYHVYYPADDDKEELSEYEFEDYEILSMSRNHERHATKPHKKKRKEKDGRLKRKKRRVIE